ncbi:MAG: LPS-assembly protein LptD [Fluviicola sp.]|nr:LPS-assembly protein LptD [Fluviicola sp.]
MCISTVGYSQIRDTIVINSGEIDQPIYYSAEDSLYSDLKNKKIHLYNNAKVDNGEVQMKAGYILIDLEKNEIYATYIYDEDSNRIQMPVFSEGSEEIVASSIRFNLKTKKGYIEEVAIKQDENFLYMEIAKKHANDEIHFRKGRFTTCDLPEPHYHFQLSKAIMIPEKRIVSGPMNLWINGVPTPLGLPFIVIPQQEDRTHGFIFPQIVPISQYGFGVQDLGYYVPINDQLQTTFFGTLFSRGSWGLRNRTDYAKRYKHLGTVDVGFQRFKSGFPSNTVQSKVSVLWNHRQDAKANPYWNFSSKVNFISDNNSKNNLDPLNAQIFNNSFNSDINLTRSFPGKPMSAGVKFSMRQNSLTKNISMTSPVVNFNVTRFYPLKRFVTGNSGVKEIIKRFGVTYSFEGQNRSTFGDSLLNNADFNRIGDQFQNGISQRVVIQTTASLFKNTWKFTPSIDYRNLMNFQQTRKTYDPATFLTATDTLQQLGMSHNLSFRAQLNTAVYSYYKFIGKREPLLRHVLTPSFSFSYVPNLNQNLSYVANATTIEYSPFEQSLYRVSQTRDQALISFGFNNTFELKFKSKKDTVTGFKKTRLIDALTFSGNYDLLKDSMNLSNINIGLRISPIRWLNFVANSSFSPYEWNDTTGVILGGYAISNGKLGRLLSTNLSTTLTLTSKESREKLKESTAQIEPNWNSDFNYFLLHPEFIVNYNIPWKVSLSHIYTINANTNITSLNPDRTRKIQTLMLNGDLSFTKRWKLASTINFDLQESMITNARFALSRDLHCWSLAFNWIPIGTNKSFLFSLRSTSALFKDAKIDIKKPPAFL